MSDDTDSLRFKKILESVQAILKDAKERVFYLHSPIGLILVRRFHFNYSLGFVAVDGLDENKKRRFFVLTDDVICSCALEVRKIKEFPENSVGFKSTPIQREDQS